MPAGYVLSDKKYHVILNKIDIPLSVVRQLASNDSLTFLFIGSIVSSAVMLCATHY